jgi:hypothetical protein
VLRGIDVLRQPVLWARAEGPDDPRRAELVPVALRLESLFTQPVQRVTRRVRDYIDAARARRSSALRQQCGGAVARGVSDPSGTRS